MNLQLQQLKLFLFILQVVGLASTLLQLVRLTCLVPDSLTRTYIYIIVSLTTQVVGLVFALLQQLLGLTCLIADTPKKTLENELTTTTIIFIYPPGSLAGLHPAAAGETDLPAS
jgi:hypothetical protein